MYRIGFGYDVHRLVEGRKLILGGMTVPFELGLEGHSDADVLIHSVIDALLGALALGDIGSHFPDTDQAYKDIDSRELLRKVFTLVTDKGYLINNLDCTICASQPKLSPFVGQMRENIAHDLDCPAGLVSVKATTEEGLGVSGAGGIACHSVAMLRRV
jgi:2-C-methyl-D-erythritol 2,4-cyclodiphosphate synthase